MSETIDPVWAVGLMTGTVLDGQIDVALLKTDGETVTEFGPFELVSYPEEVNDLLARTLKAALDWGFEGPEPAIFAEAEAAISRAQAEAVRRVVEGAGMSMDDISIVGFHGQSVLHRAPSGGEKGRTRQLGDGAVMAGMLGTDVAFDFRTADMAAGGQGAPLSAIYHKALLETAGYPEGTAVLNLGGVANVTWCAPDGRIAAFDTGPANAPINDFVKSRGAGPMDVDGKLGLAGTVDPALLAERMDDPYFARGYPKSLDRFDFGFDWVDLLSTEDGAATLTAFSASAVGAGLDRLPERPARLVVCGGGRRNPALMQMLGTYAGAEAIPAEEMGWRGDAIEAECFALLAVRALRGLPYSFPTTTGVPAPMTGARIARAPGHPEALRLTTAGAKGVEQKVIYDGLMAYNEAAFGASNAQDLTVTLRDDAGEIVAGLSGRTAWGYAYIQWLWVAEGHRGQGLAGRLLEAAFDEARARGCHGAHIDTSNPDALAAYKRAGFEVFGELPDFPKGHVNTHLFRRL